LLGSAVSVDTGAVNLQLVGPVLYLLDVVLPVVPPKTLRSYYSSTIPIVTLVISALSDMEDRSSEGTAAVVKSAVGAIESLLLAQEFSAWKSRDELSVQHVFTGYLVVPALDPRPKVRKRILEAIKKILSNPPASPSALHPAGESTAIICFNTVQAQFNQTKKKRSKEKVLRDAKAIHSLQLLKTVASAVLWPSSSIRELVDLLLKLSSETYDNVVRLSALEVFQVVFAQAASGMDKERLLEVIEVISITRISKTKMVLFDKPAESDNPLVPSWLAVIAAGYTAYGELDPDDCLKRIPALLRQMFPFLQAGQPGVCDAVGSTLVVLAESCMSVQTSPEIRDGSFPAIAELALQGLTSRYRLAWREVFRFVGALFLSLGRHANPLFLDTITIIDALRTAEGFEGKSEAEAVIGAAVTGIGPAAVLKVLPLNLEIQRFLIFWISLI
jgi:ribosomal RNA-processing protein 12